DRTCAATPRRPRRSVRPRCPRRPGRGSAPARPGAAPLGCARCARSARAGPWHEGTSDRWPEVVSILTKLRARGETAAMVSIVVHFPLGLACVAGIVASTPKIYANPAGGPWLSPLECVYYLAGIASIVLGYWFNIHFVMAAHGQGNLFEGP